MIAVDTNVLVYAHRADSEWHLPAYPRLAELAEGRAALCLQHGVRELRSVDRDFGRYSELTATNPLVA
jgi:predicted nucleic acid-binding protein